jgi:hypothetical protein
LAIYTGLRLALLAAVWLIVQLVTPWRGLLAIAVAVAVSGVIGFFVLDRTRDSASESVWRVFRGIDDRIKRHEMQEDALVEASYGVDASRGVDAHRQGVSEGVDSAPRETTEVLSTRSPAFDQPPTLDQPTGSPAPDQGPTPDQPPLRPGQCQADSQNNAVDTGQDPAQRQDRDQIAPGGTVDDDEAGAHRQG